MTPPPPSLPAPGRAGIAAVTLGEGGTPLVRSAELGPALGLKNLWFKLESANPTGSYKDRFAASAVTRMLADGRRACLGTSSGNAGAALAAYCARAGLPCVLAIVEDAPDGKLRQMLAHGARLVRIRGFGRSPAVNDRVMHGLRGLAGRLNAAVEISAYAFSPEAMRGVEAIGAEISARLPAPDVFCPAGGGGLTLAVARGLAAGRVHCVQPAGNDTIASPLRAGRARARPVSSDTAISGLQVGNVVDGDAVIAACRARGGRGYVVADERAWHWQARLARAEGIFCEPAGSLALAGVEEAVRRRELPAHADVVCLVTGAGFKDERALVRLAGSGRVERVDDVEAFGARVLRDCERAGPGATGTARPA